MQGDSETSDGSPHTHSADVTDNLCVRRFTKLVLPDATTGDYQTPEFIYPDLQRVKQEPADDYNTEGSCFTVQVRAVFDIRHSVMLYFAKYSAKINYTVSQKTGPFFI